MPSLSLVNDSLPKKYLGFLEIKDKKILHAELLLGGALKSGINGSNLASLKRNLVACYLEKVEDDTDQAKRILITAKTIAKSIQFNKSEPKKRPENHIWKLEGAVVAIHRARSLVMIAEVYIKLDLIEEAERIAESIDITEYKNEINQMIDAKVGEYSDSE